MPSNGQRIIKSFDTDWERWIRENYKAIHVNNMNNRTDVTVFLRILIDIFIHKSLNKLYIKGNNPASKNEVITRIKYGKLSFCFIFIGRFVFYICGYSVILYCI